MSQTKNPSALAIAKALLADSDCKGEDGKAPLPTPKWVLERLVETVEKP
jgi:hypothetical protein